MSAVKFHLSPKTQRPERCRAQFRPCEYDHYSSKGEALEAMETAALREAGDTLPATQSRRAAGTGAASERPSVPLGELRVADEVKREGSYHYQELWIRDETGAPMVYAKVNLLKWGQREDGSSGYIPGVVLCDVEVRPEGRGRGYPLELIRKLKETYSTDTVQFTGTFSEGGYRMFKALEKRQQETGESLVSIEPGMRAIEPPPGESYDFVDDWDSERGKYPL